MTIEVESLKQVFKLSEEDAIAAIAEGMKIADYIGSKLIEYSVLKKDDLYSMATISVAISELMGRVTELVKKTVEEIHEQV